MKGLSNLGRITKSGSKGKGRTGKVLKFHQLRRSIGRTKKLERKKLDHEVRKQKEFSIIYFFQDVLKEDPDNTDFSIRRIHDIIKLYLTRFDEELDELKSERRVGRPASKRQLEIEEINKKEAENYRSGIQVPEIYKKVVRERLKDWNGTGGALTAMTFFEIKEDTNELPTEEIEMK